MDVAHVWVAKDDGSDIVRAEVIARVGIDGKGLVTAQLTSGDDAMVTLVEPGTQHGHHTPDDFHRQLIRALAELSDAAGPSWSGRFAITSTAGAGTTRRSDPRPPGRICRPPHGVVT
jgi:hypothetical protein